jgi:hypothetical protein
MKVKDFDAYLEDLEIKLFEAAQAVKKLRVENSPTCKECPERLRTFFYPPCKDCEILGSEALDDL